MPILVQKTTQMLHKNKAWIKDKTEAAASTCGTGSSPYKRQASEGSVYRAAAELNNVTTNNYHEDEVELSVMEMSSRTSIRTLSTSNQSSRQLTPVHI